MWDLYVYDVWKFMDRVCLKISVKIGNKDIIFEEIYCG